MSGYPQRSCMDQCVPSDLGGSCAIYVVGIAVGSLRKRFRSGWQPNRIASARAHLVGAGARASVLVGPAYSTEELGVIFGGADGAAYVYQATSESADTRPLTAGGEYRPRSPHRQRRLPNADVWRTSRRKPLRVSRCPAGSRTGATEPGLLRGAPNSCSISRCSAAYTP